MNARVILLLASGLFANAYGQPARFSSSWGNTLEADKGAFRIQVLKSDASGILLLKEKPNSNQVMEPHTVERLAGPELQLKVSLELDHKEGKERYNPEFVTVLGKKLMCFYSGTRNKDQKIVLYVKEFSLETLQPEGNRKLTELGLPGIPKGGFKGRISPDSTKLLLTRRISQRDGAEKYWLFMLDQDTKMLWEKEITLPSVPGDFEIESMRVNNEGDGFILGNAKGHFQLLTIQHRGDSIARYPIYLDKLVLTSVQIELLGKTNLLCAGFFSEQKEMNVQGAYFINLDLAASVLKAKQLIEFDPKFILQNLSKQDYKWSISRTEAGARAELYQYSLDRIIPCADGGALLVGEQHYKYANAQYYYTTTGGNYPSRTTSNRGSLLSNQNRLSTPTQVIWVNSPNALKNYHYVFNDIVAVKINPDGTAAWMQKIYKSQNTVDDDGVFSSYFVAAIEDQVHFIFNDNPRNVGTSTFERPVDFTGAKTNLVMISVDLEGNQQREMLHEYGDSDVTIMPRMSGQSGNELILYGHRKSHQQVAKVRFNPGR